MKRLGSGICTGRATNYRYLRDATPRLLQTPTPQAAATTALLQLAEGGDSFRYRLQPGERLLCAPGASPSSQPTACVLEAS